MNAIVRAVRSVLPFLLIGLLAPLSAKAQEARELCPDRPGLGTPACTVAPGEVVGELGLGDWTRDSNRDARTDTLLAGDALGRIGLSESLEGQIGWTAFGHARTRERPGGMVSRQSGVGDVTLALRKNLRNPDGSGLSLAVMPYATLPVGGAPLGAGDWGAGLILPVSADLGQGFSLSLTPQIDAAVDSDGHGRHLSYGSVAGLGFSLSEAISATAEVALTRDHDSAGHSTETLGGFSAGWQLDDDTQIDLGVNLGLNAASPDSEIYFGIARRF